LGLEGAHLWDNKFDGGAAAVLARLGELEQARATVRAGLRLTEASPSAAGVALSTNEVIIQFISRDGERVADGMRLAGVPEG
jgi:hypothetical protein